MKPVTTEPKWVRVLLIFLALGFLLCFLMLPLFVILFRAFESGVQLYWDALRDPDAWSAIKLTLLAVGVAVPLNTAFGICASWLITKFDFFGKNLVLSLIDLPFTISPVISGLMFILLFGTRGLFGTWFADHHMAIVFHTPGIVLVTAFVTFPFVARELIPLMQAQGTDEEVAALTLGASGWQTFWRVTLPNIKWGLLYGVVLCTARAAGEFGAVSVVSGHIRGLTNTLPLHIEILYNEYNFTAAFAMSSLMVFFAIITLTIKQYIERKLEK